MPEVLVGGRPIGPGRPAFVIAEMSANHDRDLEHALALVEIAAEAQVDALKLQTYSADSLTIPSSHPSARVDPVWGASNLHELYTRSAMPMEFHEPIVQRAADLELMVFTSVYDPRDVDFCEQFDFPAYKVASFELVHLPLLRRLAMVGKPVILSTGMANLGEVEEALTALGDTPVVLLHCCSAYPADAAAVNLAAMDTLRAAFGLPVGFSDHTLGTHLAVAAVARGACAIEKHYTSDRTRNGPDHRFSLEPHELCRLTTEIRDVESAVGDARKHAVPAEIANREAGRRSLLAARDIGAGETITAEAVRVARPGSGLHPRYLDAVIGRVARRSIPSGHPLTWLDI